jgi:signal transduction histidine kinase
MQRLTDHDLLALNRAATTARLLAGLAHEVNNALLVVGGTAELMADQTDKPEAIERGVARISAQVVRAAGAIGEVLGFARGAPDARGRVNLRDMVAGAVGLRAYAIGRAGLTVRFTAPDHRSFIVEGSRVLLQQAVLNLIMNAEQALKGSKGAIRIELAERDGCAVLRVADTGGGVPADQTARIFEPFVTSGAPWESTGLGLPAARCIAGMHGGTLALEGTDAGASFVLTLPLT